MCSHDWGKKYVIGNLKESKILDVLNKKHQYARKKLLN